MTRYLGTAPVDAGRQAEARSAVSLVELAITDRLELATLPLVNRRLDEVLSLRPQHLVMDLARCPFIDAAAIGLLLDVHRRMWLMDGRLTLRAPATRLLRIFHAARVDHVLHITPAAESPLGSETASMASAGPATQGM
jgi:anti-anti-sigma factor